MFRKKDESSLMREENSTIILIIAKLVLLYSTFCVVLRRQKSVKDYFLYVKNDNLFLQNLFLAEGNFTTS